MKTLLKHGEVREYVTYIFNTIKIKDGIARITDGDFLLSIPTDKPDGFYKIKEARVDVWRNVERDDSEYGYLHFPEGLTSTRVPVNVSELEWVSSAMSKDEKRFYLNGVYFDKSGMTATDGRILKHIETLGEDLSAILPRFAVKIILDAAKEEKISDIEIRFTSDRAFVVIGRYSLISKLIDGNFPDYNRVIPNQNQFETLFDSEEFKPLLKKAKALDKHTQSIILSSNSCHIGKLPEDSIKISGDWKLPYMFNCGLLVSSDMKGIVCYSQDNRNPIKITEKNKIFVVLPQGIK